MRIDPSAVNPSRLPTTTGHLFMVTIALQLIITSYYGPFLYLYFIGPNLNPTSPQVENYAYLAAGGLCITGLFLFLTAIAYAIHPFILRRSFGPPSELAPDLGAYNEIARCARQLNVPVPEILVAGDMRYTDAISFGARRRKTILLGKGLLRISATSAEKFKAIIGHELGHIYNNDIVKTFLSYSSTICISFLFILSTIMSISIYIESLNTSKSDSKSIILTEIFSRFAGFDATVTFNLTLTLLKISFFAILLIIIVALYLRTREFYADSVSSNLGARDQLISTLNTARKREIGTEKEHLLKTHPAIIHRIDAINHPETMLRISGLGTFLTGYIIGFQLFLLLNLPIFPYLNQFSSLPDIYNTVFENKFYTFLFLYITIQTVPMLLIISTQVFHAANSIILYNGKFLNVFIRLSLQIIVFYSAINIGNTVNPIIVEHLILTSQNPLAAFIIAPSDAAIFHITSTVAIMSILLAPVLHRLYTSPSDTPPRWYTIIALFYTFCSCVSYLQMIIQIISDNETLGTESKAIYYFSMWFILYFIISYVLARRSIRLSFISSRDPARWLVRQTVTD